MAWTAEDRRKYAPAIQEVLRQGMLVRLAATIDTIDPPCKTGRPRDWSTVTMLGALWHLARDGCAWRRLPVGPCLPPHQSVWSRLLRWRLRAVLAVETIRGIPGRGKVTAEIRHYLSSAELPPVALAAAIRNHWRIENGLHWILDVGFREDASRIRERNAARNLGLLRKIALNLARADATVKASLKGKRKYAGWDDAFMATLIAG